MTFVPLGREPRVVAIVSARMASSRFPGKALAPLAGRPLLEVLLERVASCPLLDSLALATSSREENVPLAALAQRMGIPVFRGDEEDVLRRYVECARHMGADHVVRVTGDNPLTDLETMERLIERQLDTGAEYTYVPGDALLMGVLSEVVSRHALERSWEKGEARHRSELVTLYIKEHPREFRIQAVDLPPGLYRPQYRLTVDEPDDVRLMQALFERLAAPGKLVTTRDAIALLDAQPQLAEINAHLGHKAHNVRSVELDDAVRRATGLFTTEGAEVKREVAENKRGGNK